MERIDRFRGAMLGLATGDALGAAVEFMARGSFTPVTEMDRETVHGNPPGYWTDDTSMALCLAESLIERGGMDLADQLGRYLRWRDEGHLSSTGRCFDIGNTTTRSLSNFSATGDPRSGGTAPDKDAGNGSIMRLAPVPLFFASSREAATERSGESSLATHGTPEAMDGCRYFGAVIHAAINAASKEDILSEETAPADLAPKIAEVSSGSFKRKSGKQIRGTGYVVASLEAALWAFHHSESFEGGALLAVNLGEDADTTGAVYGQVAGAFYGESGIPERWLAKIVLREEITALADRLHGLSQDL